MSEYSRLLEFSRPDFVKALSSRRDQDQGILTVLVHVSNGSNIELTGFDDLAESMSNLIQAEKVIISKEIASGKEFGTIRIECWLNESYSEFFCDTAE